MQQKITSMQHTQKTATCMQTNSTQRLEDLTLVGSAGIPKPGGLAGLFLFFPRERGRMEEQELREADLEPQGSED